METRDFFIQKSYKIEDLGDGKGYIYSNELIGLIQNEEVKDYVIMKYELNEEVKIEFEKIDLLIPIIKKYVNRFSLIRLITTDNKVTTSFANNEYNDVIFKIKDAKFDGVEVDELDAIGIYDSINMFYDGRRLSQYVNYLKNGLRDPSLLSAVNKSWDTYYEKKDRELKPRVYRVLSDEANNEYFLKGINSEKYKEYGVAETFVLTILELHKLSKIKNERFQLSAIALSESKIEIILRASNNTQIEKLGYVYPSITVRNEDQGNVSIGFYSSLEFKLANVDENGTLHFFPNRQVKDIKTQKTYDHRVTVQTFVDSYLDIGTFFHDASSFKDDFYFLKNSKSPDELRAKIEEKIVSNRSPFKGIKQLKDLFTRDKVGHIDNLTTLLKLCGRAEMIDMDYDLKFKLRYLISNVLLYGNNQLD